MVRDLQGRADRLARYTDGVFNDDGVGRYLFHYTTAETFLAHILPTMQLRLSPLSQVNDPKEASTWYFVLGDDVGGALNDADGLIDVQKQFDFIVRRCAKVLCFTRDDPQIDSTELHLRPYRRGWAHSRMWDQYARRHSGVCLVLAIDTIGDEIAGATADRGTLLHQGVAYADEPPTSQFWAARQFLVSRLQSEGVEAAFRRDREEHAGIWYFYKSTDWATEYEYRWVLLADDADSYEYVPIVDSLAGVIFGPNYPTDSIGMVQLLLGREVELARMGWINGRPEVTPLNT